MEIQQLRHFLCAAQLGNIGKAAEQLGITQSGLSRSISNLEEQIGVQLLIRNPRGVEPTFLGRALIPYAQSILNVDKRAVADIRALKSAEGGSVRIGITSNFVYYFMPDIITDIATSLPKIEIIVYSGTFGELIERLNLADLDLVFGLIDGATKLENYVVANAFDSTSSIYARPDHALAKKPHVTVDELAKHAWGLVDSAGFQRVFQEHFIKNGVTPPGCQLKSNSLGLLKGSMQQLNLLTILPDKQVSSELERGILVKIDSETPGATATAGLLHRRDQILMPAAEKCLELIKSHIKLKD
jgi:DNA-binding transcriptional LysR family regulator